MILFILILTSFIYVSSLVNNHDDDDDDGPVPPAATYAQHPVYSQKVDRQDAPSYVLWMSVNPADVIGSPAGEHVF